MANGYNLQEDYLNCVLSFFKWYLCGGNSEQSLADCNTSVLLGKTHICKSAGNNSVVTSDFSIIVP